MFTYGLICLFCFVAQLPYPWTWSNIVCRVILGLFVVPEVLFDIVLLIGWMWEIVGWIRKLFKKKGN